MAYDIDAIIKAYPDAVSADSVLGAFDKDGKNISIDDAKVTEARTELDKLKYRDKRLMAFPSIQEQLDLQYWDKVNGTTKWQEAIAKVKSDYPKPS